MNYAGFSASPGLGQSGTAPTFFLNPAGVWEAALPGSTWIGEAATAGPGGTNPPSGFYTFTTTFNSSGNYTGSITVEADDTTAVFLNGSMIIGEGALGGDLHCADGVPNCRVTDTVNISGATGANTLTFVVQQAGLQEPGADPSGMDFDGTINVAASVPEPGSLMLLGTGVLSSMGMLLRRKRT